MSVGRKKLSVCQNYVAAFSCCGKFLQYQQTIYIVVDENLSWDEQYNTLKGKIYGGLSSLKKLKNIIPQTKLCSVYYAIVESHLRYANEIWGSFPKTKLDALQRLQDRAQTVIDNIILFDRSVMAYKIIKRI